MHRLVAVSAAVACMVALGLGTSGCADGSSAAASNGADGVRAAVTDATDAIVPLTDPSEPRLPVTVRSAAVSGPEGGASGERVRVEDVSRILPLTSGVAEIVFTLGLGDRVVGRDIGTTFAQAQDLPLVTRAHDVGAEGVLALKPTVVLADPGTGPPEALDQIRAAGVPVVVVPEAWELDEVAPRIRAVAQALGVPADGERLVDRTEDDIAAARDALDGSPTIAFLYLRGQASIYLIGGDGAGADSLIEALGATDAGTKAGLSTFTPLTAEAMVAAQPDVLLVMTKGLDSVGGVDGLIGLPGIGQTPAGRERRVVAVDDGLLLGFGPRTGAVMRLIAEEVNRGDDAAAQQG
jgi:iron complex transport system substrate-binding protein